MLTKNFKDLQGIEKSLLNEMIIEVELDQRVIKNHFI